MSASESDSEPDDSDVVTASSSGSDSDSLDSDESETVGLVGTGTLVVVLVAVGAAGTGAIPAAFMNAITDGTKCVGTTKISSCSMGFSCTLARLGERDDVLISKHAGDQRFDECGVVVRANRAFQGRKHVVETRPDDFVVWHGVVVLE